MPDVASDPRLVTVALIGAALVYIASLFPKILGPVGESLSAAALKLRRTSDELQSIDLEAIRRRLAVVEEQAHATEERLRADIRGLRGELACRDARMSEAESRLDDMREAEHAHDVALAAHARWDRVVMVRLAQEGISIPEPPPLWRVDT